MMWSLTVVLALMCQYGPALACLSGEPKVDMCVSNSLTVAGGVYVDTALFKGISCDCHFIARNASSLMVEMTKAPFLQNCGTDISVTFGGETVNKTCGSISANIFPVTDNTGVITISKVGETVSGEHLCILLEPVGDAEITIQCSKNIDYLSTTMKNSQSSIADNKTSPIPETTTTSIESTVSPVDLTTSPDTSTKLMDIATEGHPGNTITDKLPEPTPDIQSMNTKITNQTLLKEMDINRLEPPDDIKNTLLQKAKNSENPIFFENFIDKHRQPITTSSIESTTSDTMTSEQPQSTPTLSTFTEIETSTVGIKITSTPDLTTTATDTTTGIPSEPPVSIKETLLALANNTENPITFETTKLKDVAKITGNTTPLTTARDTTSDAIANGTESGTKFVDSTTSDDVTSSVITTSELPKTTTDRTMVTDSTRSATTTAYSITADMFDATTSTETTTVVPSEPPASVKETLLALANNTENPITFETTKHEDITKITDNTTPLTTTTTTTTTTTRDSVSGVISNGTKSVTRFVDTTTSDVVTTSSVITTSELPSATDQTMVTDSTTAYSTTTQRGDITTSTETTATPSEPPASVKETLLALANNTENPITFETTKIKDTTTRDSVTDVNANGTRFIYTTLSDHVTKSSIITTSELPSTTDKTKITDSVRSVTSTVSTTNDMKTNAVEISSTTSFAASTTATPTSSVSSTSEVSAASSSTTPVVSAKDTSTLSVEVHSTTEDSISSSTLNLKSSTDKSTRSTAIKQTTPVYIPTTDSDTTSHIASDVTVQSTTGSTELQTSTTGVMSTSTLQTPSTGVQSSTKLQTSTHGTAESQTSTIGVQTSTKLQTSTRGTTELQTSTIGMQSSTDSQTLIHVTQSSADPAQTSTQDIQSKEKLQTTESITVPSTTVTLKTTTTEHKTTTVKESTTDSKISTRSPEQTTESTSTTSSMVPITTDLFSKWVFGNSEITGSDFKTTESRKSTTEKPKIIIKQTDLTTSTVDETTHLDITSTKLEKATTESFTSTKMPVIHPKVPEAEVSSTPSNTNKIITDKPKQKTTGKVETVEKGIKGAQNETEEGKPHLGHDTLVVILVGVIIGIIVIVAIIAMLTSFIKSKRRSANITAIEKGNVELYAAGIDNPLMQLQQQDQMVETNPDPGPSASAENFGTSNGNIDSAPTDDVIHLNEIDNGKASQSNGLVNGDSSKSAEVNQVVVNGNH